MNQKIILYFSQFFLTWDTLILLRLSITCELCSINGFVFRCRQSFSNPFKGQIRGLWLVDFDPFCLFLFFVCFRRYYDWRSEKRNRYLGFELHSSHVIERRSNLDTSELSESYHSCHSITKSLLVQWSALFVFRCGSVIIDFVMNFNQSVDVSEVLTVLKDAAQQNKFGEYKVDPNSIKQISPSSTVTPSTQGRV